ncbi:unnamed protein product [Caenorhabditis sp. 36 PRJEB53466]|nr:unnamed protein product [Caenorhabditis sp. 36 PRJEB53466]
MSSSPSPAAVTEIWNHLRIRVDNTYDYGWLILLLVSFGIFAALVASGAWCIYAARKIKEESSVYHFESEFKPDDEKSSRRSKRSNAGSDCEAIEMETETETKSDSRANSYFQLLARSFV